MRNTTRQRNAGDCQVGVEAILRVKDGGWPSESDLSDPSVPGERFSLFGFEDRVQGQHALFRRQFENFLVRGRESTK
jgi:hypothetical protein